MDNDHEPCKRQKVEEAETTPHHSSKSTQDGEEKKRDKGMKEGDVISQEGPEEKQGQATHAGLFRGRENRR